MSPYEVDSQYSIGASAQIHTDAESLSSFLDSAVVPVLEKYGFIVGFSTGAADDVMPLTKATQGTEERDGLAVSVLRFPDPASATAAAKEIDSVDFAANKENVAVTLPQYADASAHWRPSVPTLGTTIAHGVFVVSILADSRSIDLGRLIDKTQKYLKAELPELDKFSPTPVARLGSLQQDPDHVLVRTLHTSGEVSAPDGQGEAVYSLRGYLNYIQDQSTRYPVLLRAGVDRVALTPQIIVFRTRDDAAAQRFIVDSAGLGSVASHEPADPPRHVPGAVCVQDTTAPDAAQIRCFVSYRRYVALILGQRLWQTQELAAAQYALLANAQALLPN